MFPTLTMSMQIKLFIAFRVSYIVPKAHDYQNVPYPGEVQKMVPKRVGSMMIKMFLSSRCQSMVSNYGTCWPECSFLPHVVHVDKNVHFSLMLSMLIRIFLSPSCCPCWSECFFLPHVVHVDENVLSPYGVHVEQIVLLVSIIRKFLTLVVSRLTGM